MEFTGNQLRAINTRGADLLVSAAAGSGKTAVLVERAIRMLSNPKKPVSVERLLVVTFTDAAAKEMRQRIASALNKKLEDDPGNSFLRRQLMLLGSAPISTIHALCLDIIRRYFQYADIDPGFRVLDEAEVSILKEQTCAELFEELHRAEYNFRLFEAFISEDEALLRRYRAELGVSDNDGLFAKVFEAYTGSESFDELDERERDDLSADLAADGYAEGFWDLIEATCRKVKDDFLQKELVRLHEAVMTNPEPFEWLGEKINYYNVDGNVSEMPWYSLTASEISLGLCGVISAAEEIMPFAESFGNEEIIRRLVSLIDGAGRANAALSSGLGTFYDFMTSVVIKKTGERTSYEYLSFDTKGLKGDKACLEILKTGKKQIDKRLRELFDNFCRKPPEEFFGDIRRSGKLAATLFELIKRFEIKYSAMKRKKSLLDFSDYEHICLKILKGPGGDSVTGELRNSFDEIFIDEYQDTSRIQEEILRLISGSPERNNRFMVGDLKQGIYGFRQASPELFREKYSAFSREESSDNQLIDLSTNFRSRRNVIDSINYIFHRIMSTDLGELEYDENTRLSFGAEFYDSVPGTGGPSEFYIIDGSLEEDTGENEDGDPVTELGGAEAEARVVAARIKELVGGRFQVFDSEGKTRDLRYSDVAILMRSVKWASEAYRRELSRLGIESFSQASGDGYFSETEISTIMSYLNIIDNPYQDIDLIAVLYSVIYSFTADELAEIRAALPRGAYYDALCLYRDKGSKAELAQKSGGFISALKRWREKTKYMPVHELLWQLMNDTGFYDCAGAMPGGRERQANLLKLYESTFEYEKSGLKGYFNFVKFYKALKKSDDSGKAKLVTEAADAVKIMTIHKSKGLEFPVVFVCGLGKRFNMSDLNSRFLFHRELGIGSDYFNAQNRVQGTTLMKEAIKTKIRAELLSEEMRCLYVALTRAREKLILVGTVKSLGSDIFAAGVLPDGRLSPAELLKKNNYIAWLLPCFYRAEDNEDFWDADGYAEAEFSGEASWKLFRLFADGGHKNTGNPQENPQTHTAEPTEGLLAEVGRILDYKYPYNTESLIPAKLSVSEINRLGEEESFGAEEENAEILELSDEPVKTPEFMGDSAAAVSAARKGTLTHLILEQLDLTQVYLPEELDGLINSLVLRGLMTERESLVIEKEKLLRFLQSPIARRMRDSKQIFKEKRFLTGLSAREINADWNSGDTVLVNGIIDCYFAEDDGLVLVDYKTDRVGKNGSADIAARYAKQLAVYRKALALSTGLEVKEAYIYLLDNGEALPMH